MKKVLYVILGLLVGYLFLCIAGPSKAGAERAVTVNVPAEQVKMLLLDLHFFQEKWSPWTEKDPNMKVTYSGETGKPGNAYSWESDNKDVGKGSLEIVGVNGDSLLQTLSFEGMGASKIYFISQADGNGTKVTWGMSSDVPFFGRGVMLFMNMDKMIGPDFEKGLAKFKNAVEGMTASPVASEYEVKEVQLEERTYFGSKKALLTMEKMAAFFEENFPKLGADFSKNKIEPSSAPTSIIFTWNDAKMEGECAAAFGVKPGTEVKGWEKYSVPAGKALLVEYFGDYNKTGAAHMAIGAYLKEKNLTQNIVLEEYITDPMAEKDTAKWQTNVYYTIK